MRCGREDGVDRPPRLAAGGDVLGLDWRVELGPTWDALGDDIAVMGNLDPLTLLAPAPVLERETRRILLEANGRPCHVFNLGHGVRPQTPVAQDVRLVDLVHEASQ